MNNYGKVALMVFALLYAASPVDMAVGPVDDMIVLLLTMILERRGAKLIK